MKYLKTYQQINELHSDTVFSALIKAFANKDWDKAASFLKSYDIDTEPDKQMVTKSMDRLSTDLWRKDRESEEHEIIEDTINNLKNEAIGKFLEDTESLRQYTHDDVLDSALYDLMGEIYVTSGDNSGMFFSDFGEEDGFEDADTAWENYDEEKRLETLIDYISYEYED